MKFLAATLVLKNFKKHIYVFKGNIVDLTTLDTALAFSNVVPPKKFENLVCHIFSHSSPVG